MKQHPANLLRRRCQNKEVRRLILDAIATGARYRLTRSGVTVYGPHGTAGTHFTNSDHRSARNFAADLQRIGVDL